MYAHELRTQEVRKFGQVIKSICTNCTWNEYIIPIEELVTDFQIRPSPDLLTSMENDSHATIIIIVEMRISNFYFLVGCKEVTKAQITDPKKIAKIPLSSSIGNLGTSVARRFVGGSVYIIW